MLRHRVSQLLRHLDKNKEVMQARENAMSGEAYGPAGTYARHEHTGFTRPLASNVMPQRHIPGIRAALRRGDCAAAEKHLAAMRRSMGWFKRHWSLVLTQHRR